MTRPVQIVRANSRVADDLERAGADKVALSLGSMVVDGLENGVSDLPLSQSITLVCTS